MATKTPTTKQCPTCGEWFERNGFPPRRSHSATVTACISCDYPLRAHAHEKWLAVRRERRRARDAENPEQARAVMLAYEAKRVRDPVDWRRSGLLRKKRYPDIVAKQANARKARYRTEGNGKAKDKAWKTSNREAIVKYDADRRARMLMAPGGGWKPSDVTEIKKMQRGVCAMCRVKLPRRFHRDHIVPLKRGGAHDRRNLQLLCEPCNLSKGARDPIDHARTLGLLL